MTQKLQSPNSFLLSHQVFPLAACIFHASLRFAGPVAQPRRALATLAARGASRRQLEAEDFRELLERPEGAQDLQELQGLASSHMGGFP